MQLKHNTILSYIEKNDQYREVWAILFLEKYCIANI